MKEFDIDPFPIECIHCKKEITMKLSHFKKGRIITCPHCRKKYRIDDNYYEQIQNSIRNLQKTISDVQKEINKSFK